jgi:hypothetical protein
LRSGNRRVEAHVSRGDKTRPRHDGLARPQLCWGGEFAVEDKKALNKRRFTANRKRGWFALYGYAAEIRLLQRNLLYTGVTRGKRLVVLVGQKKAVAIAVRNSSGRRRWSKLQEWLRPVWGVPTGHLFPPGAPQTGLPVRRCALASKPSAIGALLRYLPVYGSSQAHTLE